MDLNKAISDYTFNHITEVGVMSGKHWGNKIKFLYTFLALVAVVFSYASVLCAQEIIIDNRDAGTMQTGVWASSGATDFYGTDSVWARATDGADTFTWSFTAPQTSTYEVWEWHSSWSSRTTRAPYQITYDGGSTIVYVNQQVNGGTWNSLGVYPFTAGNTYSIRLSSVADSSSTCADAVKINLLSSEPTVSITFPQSYHLQPSPNLTVRASTLNLNPGEGIRFVIDESTSSEQILVDVEAPYEQTFTGLAETEHTIDAYIIDSQGVILPGPQAHARVIQIGIGDYYVGYGNSITAGTGDDDASDNSSADGRSSGNDGRGYQPILNDVLTGSVGVPHFIANAGTGGTTSADGFSQVSTLLANHVNAQRILIEYGTNDAIIATPIASGRGLNPGDAGYPGTFKANMQGIIDAIRGAGKEPIPGKPPIIRGSGGTVYNNPDAEPPNLRIKEYCQVIDELVTDPANNINVAPPNFYKYFNSVDSETGQFRYLDQYFDDLHPNGEGYRSMASVWADYLTNTKAVIQSISPSPAFVGASTTFSGYGKNAYRAIVNYEWTSSETGFLSNLPSFAIESLSEGIHTISFRVQDEDGAWSEPDTQTLNVIVPPTNGLINGSFEQDYTGWTASGNMDIQTSTATDGVKAVRFNAGQKTPNGVLSQSFATTAGQLYALEFDYGVYSPVRQREQRLSVTVRGTAVLLSQVVSRTALNSAVQWTSHTYAFTADSAVTTLTFQDVSPTSDSIDSYLDNVRVTEDGGGGVTPAPVITAQPLSLTVSEGSSATFSVTATGTGLNYQWRFNGSSMSGATASSYTIASVQGSDAGTYDVVVSNDGGSVTSSGAVLTVSTLTNGLINGSFEQDYTGWTASGNMDIQTSTATDGVKAVRFNAGQKTPNGVLSQSFATTAGQLYALEFDYGVYSPVRQREQRLSVTVRGTAVLLSQVVSRTALNSAVQWTSHTYAFTADSAVTTLTFQDVSPTSDSIDSYLDNVRVEVGTPPPVATTENMYVCLGYRPWDVINIKADLESILQTMGASRSGDTWEYSNQTLNKTFVIRFIQDQASMKQALETEGSHVLFVGHSNYGLGPVFSTSTENYEQTIWNLYTIDDPRVFSLSSPWMNVSLSGMRTSQAFPNWWPVFQDGTSGIMPYDFDDPRGDPPFNYYISYQIPGDSTYHKMESVNFGAIERFPDSGIPAWFSADGRLPDPANPDELQGGQWNALGEFDFEPGDYSVVLSDQSTSGRVVADGLRIGVSTNPPDLVQANFYATNRYGAAPLEVEFNMQGTGDITTFQWNLGDGYTNSTRDNLIHTYTRPGTYTVSLTVNGPEGSSTKTVSDYIVVGSVTPILRAEFSGRSREGTIPLTASFTDRSSGEIVAWSWDFDNDGVEDSNERYPRHTYSEPGNYTVRLTVTDGNGNTSVSEKENFIVARVFDKLIDNVDYPKSHYRSKTILFRKDLKVTKENLRYSRLFYDSCNSGNYFLDTFNRGIVFYTINTSPGLGFAPYLKAYLEGKSDQEIWTILQSHDPVYDYYDFNKLPSEQ